MRWPNLCQSKRRRRNSGVLPRLSEIANIPEELRKLPQWVGWRSEMRADKWTKVPYDPHTGRRASSVDPSTWGYWDVAMKRAIDDQMDGIGFVFAKGGGHVGVDLDHVRDPETGGLEDWALAMIRKLDGYTELSPSGTGVHIIVRGALPPGRRRKGPIEMYDSGRFFTMTGKMLHA